MRVKQFFFYLKFLNVEDDFVWIFFLGILIEKGKCENMCEDLEIEMCFPSFQMENIFKYLRELWIFFILLRNKHNLVKPMKARVRVWGQNVSSVVPEVKQTNKSESQTLVGGL